MQFNRCYKLLSEKFKGITFSFSNLCNCTKHVCCWVFVGQIWYICWENYIKINTSCRSRFLPLRRRTDAYHNSLFVLFSRIWSNLPNDVSSEIGFSLFLFLHRLHQCSFSLTVYLFIFIFLINCVFVVCVSLVSGILYKVIWFAPRESARDFDNFWSSC